MSAGLEKAWEELRGLDPQAVCTNSLVRYDLGEGYYIANTLGFDAYVNPKDESITAREPNSIALIKGLSYYFDHAMLWYMVRAREMGITGRLVRPSNLRGGHHFFTGTHELPLSEVSEKYGSDRDLFSRRAKELGGKELDFGDASFELRPLPRIPLTLILWLGDDEFPPRADLLFDSSAGHQAAIDVNWSVAMYSLKAML